MNPPVCKLVSVVGPQAIKDNTAWTSSVIDTAGFHHARVVFYYGTSDIAMAALSVTECDTSDGTYADIDGTVVGTDIALDGEVAALPTATDDNKFWVFDIVLQARMRYLKIAATPGDGTSGTYAAVWCELHRPIVAPHTIAQHGAAEVLNVPEYAA